MPYNVLLLNPPQLENIRINREGRCQQKVSSLAYLLVPMSLIYTAAVLRSSGFDVKVIDCMAQRHLTLDELSKEISKFSPELIITAVSIPSSTNDFKIIEHIRSITEAHLSALGMMPTVLAKESLFLSRLDSVIRAEPEMTSLELAKTLKEGGDLTRVKGLSFRKGADIIHNPDRPMIEDLDTLPYPARDLVDTNAYRLPVNKRPYTVLLPSRGCAYKCIFCQAKDYYGEKARFRSIQNIMGEIEQITEKLHIFDIGIFSDLFTAKKSFVTEFCSELLRRDIRIRWMANARVDTVDMDMLLLMKKAGCTGISLGVESCVQEILDRARKGIRVAQIRDAIRWARQARLKVLAQLIIGLPGETEETVKETLKVLLEVDPDFVQFNYAIPFPKTEFYEIASKNNWIKEKEWERFGFDYAIVETERLTRAQIKRLRRYAYIRYYLRLSMLRRFLKEVTSPEDICNLIKDSTAFLKDWVLK